MPPVRSLSDPLSSLLARRLGLLVLTLFTLLAAAGCSPFARAIKAGDEFTAQQKWAEAEDAYLRALSAEPGD